MAVDHVTPLHLLSNTDLLDTIASFSKVTCGQHRTLGYSLSEGVWVCRGCGEPQDRHETSEETVARRKAERV